MRLVNKSLSTSSITVTSILSVLLHGVVVVVLMMLYGQSLPDKAVGKGLEIELIRSVKVSDQNETDVLRKQQNVVQVSTKKSTVKRQDKKNIANTRVVTLSSTDENSDVQNNADKLNEQKLDDQPKSAIDSITTVAQSTSASEQEYSILELLHSRIADNKKYPYMAKRQRREGVSTVAFVLHPSGMIEGMHLINSSKTTALDRAALSAVKGIAPLMEAQDYLKQAERFKVDVVFQLL